jgi:hypothetical protein
MSTSRDEHVWNSVELAGLKAFQTPQALTASVQSLMKSAEDLGTTGLASVTIDIVTNKAVRSMATATTAKERWKHLSNMRPVIIAMGDSHKQTRSKGARDRWNHLSNLRPAIIAMSTHATSRVPAVPRVSLIRRHTGDTKRAGSCNSIAGQSAQNRDHTGTLRA